MFSSAARRGTSQNVKGNRSVITSLSLLRERGATGRGRRRANVCAYRPGCTGQRGILGLYVVIMCDKYFKSSHVKDKMREGSRYRKYFHHNQLGGKVSIKM